MKKGLEQDRFIVHDFTDPRKEPDHFLLNGKDYTVVIADIRMPVMNGFTFCRRIKESRPQTPVILMSAFEIGRSEFAKVMPHTTVDGFIQKPISLRELRELESICLVAEVADSLALGFGQSRSDNSKLVR
jgi:DNA-binding response OmpR family regulator